jgi:hypothetical protein
MKVAIYARVSTDDKGQEIGGRRESLSERKKLKPSRRKHAAGEQGPGQVLVAARTTDFWWDLQPVVQGSGRSQRNAMAKQFQQVVRSADELPLAADALQAA